MEAESPLDRLIDELELSVRTALVLQRAGITYIGELVQWHERDLLARQDASRKVVKELAEFLESFGLSLGAGAPDWQRPDGAAIVRP